MPSHIQRYRLNALAHRLSLTAAIFGFLTLAWIPIDLLTFELEIAEKFVAVRLLCVSVFALIFWLAFRHGTFLTLCLCLVLMIACPLSLHALGDILLTDQELGFWGAINRDLYAGLPFVVMAGLSLFPLLAIESAVLAFLVIGWEAFLPTQLGAFDWSMAISEAWILVLLAGVAMLSAMVQVFYFDSLLRRADNDPLTGAITRRSGSEILGHMFEASAAKDEPLCALFLDLDHFKSVNDTYGHDAGDTVLKDAVENLHHMIRDNDVLIRWGGEEFLVLLPKTSLEDARIVTSRIMEHWLGKRPDGAPITASIGASERMADGTDKWERLVELADNRMYVAKQTGRARCVYADA